MNMKERKMLNYFKTLLKFFYNQLKNNYIYILLIIINSVLIILTWKNKLILLVIINILLQLLLFFQHNKKLKDLKIFILIYFLSLISVGIVEYFWLFRYFDVETGKKLVPLQSLVSPTVTTLGLIITVGISYMTIRFNQKKQEMDLIYSLIKDQKNLITEEILDTGRAIKNRCKAELNPSNIAYIRIVKYLKNNKNLLLTSELKKISSRDIELLVLTSWNQYIFPKQKNILKKSRIAESHLLKEKKIKNNKLSMYHRIAPTLFNTESSEFIFKNNSLPISEVIKDITYDESVEIINNIYRIQYYKLGHLFKHFHRIIRLILEGIISNDKKIQKELLGILRAQFPEEMLILIYYNASYTYRGYGLGCLLQGTKFFGDESDFNRNIDSEEQKERTHISSSNFYFPQYDQMIISKVYGSGDLLGVPKKNKEKFESDFIELLRGLTENE